MIKTVMHFANGNVAVTDEDNQQVTFYQGLFTDVKDLILSNAPDDAVFHDWREPSGPMTKDGWARLGEQFIRLCPFYGIGIVQMGFDTIIIRNGIGIPSAEPKSNRCGLITDAHSPCSMEVAIAGSKGGDRPNWRRCVRNPAINGSAPER